MWYRCLLLLVCALSAAATQAAPDSAAVQVQRITPAGGDVPAGRQIVIQFNRAMVPVGRMERRDDEIPVDISPALPCEWRWLNTSALACQLSEAAALKPATEYRVTVRQGLAAADGAALARTVTHRFTTERPKLEQAYFQTWQGPGSPVVRLQFNLPVSRASVEKAVQFRTPQGDAIGLTLGEVTARREDAPEVLPLPGEQVFIIARPVAGEPQGGLVRRYWDAMPATPLPEGARAGLWVMPGLTTPQGPLPGVERRQVLGFDTFPEFRFLGVRCQSNDGKELRLRPPVGEGRCNPMQPVFLEFSAPVISDEIRDHAYFDPGLAGGRQDYDPWQNQRGYSSLYGAYQKGRTYGVYLPERLQARRQYRITDSDTIHDEFGRPLENLFDIVFQTDARPPNLELMYRQAVVESQVDNDVPLTVTNLRHLDIRYSGLTGAGAIPEETARLSLPPVEDIAFNVPLGLRERLGGRSGAITGQLLPEPRFPGYRPEDYRFFAQATPFQVHAKLGHFNSLVWVTDLATGEPVADARVRIYLDEYARLDAAAPALGEAVTGKDGLAQLPGRQELDPELGHQYQWDWEKPRLFVRIERGDDFALLPLDGDFEVSTGAVTNWSIYGWARPRGGFVRAWGTTAQGVYRAGDSIQYKIYVRNQDNRTLAAATRGPYQLKIMDPAGKLAGEVKDIRLDEFGALAGEFAVPETGAVGWYRFELSGQHLPGPLQALQVLVADFTPAAFKVSSRLNGDLIVAGDGVVVDTLASMHAGGPYADAKARVTARLYPRALQPEGAPLRGFYFQTLLDKRAPETVFQTEAEVDSQGELESGFIIGAEHVLYGRLDVESAVSDERGKYVAGFASAAYAGRDRYVGLRQQDWLLRQDEPSAIDVIAVDAAGAIVADTPVAVRVEHEEVTAARVKGAGNAFITRYNQQWQETARCDLRTAAEAVECRFTPPAAGRYRIVAELGDTHGRTHRTETYQWAVGKGRALWAEQPNNSLELVPEQVGYQVGDTARYLVKNPFPGAQALVTVERYGVIEQWVQPLEGSTPVLEVPITEDLIPGFYFSVVVTSPRVEAPPVDGGVDLGRPAMRMGYVKTEVRDQYKELLIEAAPAEPLYRPGDTVRIDLGARPRHGKPAPMQLAVVVLDEAVFDLIQDGKGYFDPYQGFYQLEALDLANYSLLTRLIGLQKFEKKGANAGGDGGDMDARRIDRYVSYWNPDVRLDAEGRAQVEFEAPDNLTGWRVLVLGVTATDRFGLGQTRFQVNQPTEIRPAMPNQVLQGDSFQAGFSVMNRTDRERTLQLHWRVDGLSEAPRLVNQKLLLQPYQRQVVYLPVQTREPGLLRFTLTAGDGSDRDKLVHDVPVRQRISQLTAAAYGSMTEGEVSLPVDYPAEIQPGTGGLSVVLAPTVLGNLDGAFGYLRDYPYGGWEALLSRAVMAAHFSALRSYVRPGLQWPEAEALPADVLKQTVSFQAPNGGMSFFKADDAYVSPYLSAYTALAFGWLRSGGHDVPELVENRLHEYLRSLLRRDVVPDFYSPGMASTVRAVALAALAERGALTRDDLERYRRHVPAMSLFGKAHYLQAALAVADTGALQREVLDRILGHAVQSGGKLSFNEPLDDGYVRILSTPMRTQCAILSGLSRFAAKPGGAALVGDMPARLVRAVTQERGRRDHWENTQENLFCMNALIDYARVYEQSPPALQAVARLNDKPLGEAAFVSVRDDAVALDQPMRAADVGAKQNVHLEAHGSGRLYYTLRLAYAPLRIDPNPVNAGIELRREYSIRRDGRWQLLESPLQVQRGELLRVDLYLSLPTARHFVVVDDPVPGGLEPVNRQLATASTVDADAGGFQAAGGSWYLQYSDWIGYNVSRWSFYHQELRHDAARFYSDYLPPGNYHLSYTAQVIADGEFSAPPAHAEEMYDPDVFGKGHPAVLRVGD
jgi:uncharacterized protein YfaS (alpha-2-macroglobulin family)